MNEEIPANRKVFLMADEEVFTAMKALKPEKHFVKIVEVDYDADEWDPKGHPRLPSQSFFGWMRARNDHLYDIWRGLENSTFQQITPSWTEMYSYQLMYRNQYTSY